MDYNNMFILKRSATFCSPVIYSICGYDGREILSGEGNNTSRCPPEVYFYLKDTNQMTVFDLTMTKKCCEYPIVEVKNPAGSVIGYIEVAGFQGTNIKNASQDLLARVPMAVITFASPTISVNAPDGRLMASIQKYPKLRRIPEFSISIHLPVDHNLKCLLIACMFFYAVSQQQRL